MNKRITSRRECAAGRQGEHALRLGSGHLTGDFLLADRRFYVQANAWEADTLHGRLGKAFGVIVIADDKEPLLVVRLGHFLRSCRFRESMLTPPAVRDLGSGDSCA